VETSAIPTTSSSKLKKMQPQNAHSAPQINEEMELPNLAENNDAIAAPVEAGNWPINDDQGPGEHHNPEAVIQPRRLRVVPANRNNRIKKLQEFAGRHVQMMALGNIGSGIC